MFTLGFIFKVNDSLELSVIFVPLVLPEQTHMVEVALKTFHAHVTYSLLTLTFSSSALSSSRRCALKHGHVCA